MAEGHFSRARIEAYLGRKFRTADSVDASGNTLKREVGLSNAGKPDSLNYISYWSPDLEKTKPTEDELIALKSQGDSIIKSNQAKNARRKSYGDIGDQLDMLYKDLVAGKVDSTGEWAKFIKKIKDDNPKS